MAISDPTELFHHFTNALIEDVQLGPRRAITLTLTQLLWDGPRGYYGSLKRVRFGGIEQFDVVHRCFSPVPEREIAWLGLSLTIPSKPNRLSIELTFERSGIHFGFQCQHLTIEDVAGAESPPDGSA